MTLAEMMGLYRELKARMAPLESALADVRDEGGRGGG